MYLNNIFHFVDRKAVLKYFGAEEGKEAIKSGRVRVGAPKLKRNQELTIDYSHRIYKIQTKCLNIHSML